MTKSADVIEKPSILPSVTTSSDPDSARNPEKLESESKELCKNSIDENGIPRNKVELTEDMCYDSLGYSFSSIKKWRVLSVVFLVQVSMNFNTSLYSNAIPGIKDEFQVSAQQARCGAMIFLVFYAFGCELWAPWSEELGRKPILQASLFLVNIWQLPVALATNFNTILIGRALGGLSSAGGSVTLGMIADMWETESQQYAVAFVVFSSVGGSILGPIIGGFSEKYLDWRWSIWIQLIFGVFVQILHYFMVPETRTTILMDRIAKEKRSTSGENIWGPTELIPYSQRFSWSEILITWLRPFKMFLTEPIVLVLSLLSGFSDALIFMFIQSFALVYDQWGFDSVDLGLAFVPIGLGYLIAWISFIPMIRRNIKERKDKPTDERAQFESRLWWLLYTAPCLPIGLIGFAWTSTGPPLHWIFSMIFSCIVGIANYAVYMATIDYMVTAYGPYSASATGGNGWARDFLAGVLTIPATPFFTNIGSNPLAYASTILACISLLLVMAVYIIYWKGPELRHRSPFAQQLSDARILQEAPDYMDNSKLASGPLVKAVVRSQQGHRIRQALGSRTPSIVASAHNKTPMASRGASRAASRAASPVVLKRAVQKSRRNSLSRE